jgi:3-deoxy-7-phosphoheptulonate synthase
LVDTSHGNSGKDPERQVEVLSEVGAQVRTGGDPILGVMIESNLVRGRQELEGHPADLAYGVSITDACVDFSTTEQMLEEFAADVAARIPLSRVG